jgi:hypothetical protein
MNNEIVHQSIHKHPSEHIPFLMTHPYPPNLRYLGSAFSLFQSVIDVVSHLIFFSNLRNGHKATSTYS